MSATGSLLGSTNVSSQPRTSGSSTSGSGGAAGAGGRKVPKWFKVGESYMRGIPGLVIVDSIVG